MIEECEHDMNPLWCGICQERARRKEQARIDQLWRQALEGTIDRKDEQ